MIYNRKGWLVMERNYWDYEKQCPCDLHLFIVADNAMFVAMVGAYKWDKVPVQEFGAQREEGAYFGDEYSKYMNIFCLIHSFLSILLYRIGVA